jgi:diguanylate cyclase (GGDEF)-like protein/PAS domain S-box-containing protein
MDSSEPGPTDRTPGTAGAGGSPAPAVDDARVGGFVSCALPGIVAYWDRDLRCRFANRALLEWFGRARDDVVGARLQDVIGPHSFALDEQHLRDALDGSPKEVEGPLRRADGSRRYVRAHYVPDIDAHGAVLGVWVTVTDVTAFKEEEAAHNFVASIFQNTHEGIFVTETDGTIHSTNPAFTEITGYSAEEAVGRTPRLLKSDRHEPGFYATLWQHIASTGHWKGEIWNRRKSGDVFLAWVTITAIVASDGVTRNYVCLFHDVTDAWRKDEHVRHLAFHDALTDLPNRALLSERLNRQIAMADRERREIAVMFIDLDGFKDVNDRFGHKVGDELLKVVAHRLQAMIRSSDTVARLSGDEFVVKLNNPENRDEVGHIAQRIIAAVNEPVEIQLHRVRVGASVGIAMFPGDGRTAVDLLENADSAMYAAKLAGKGAYRFFDATMAGGGSARRE